ARAHERNSGLRRVWLPGSPERAAQEPGIPRATIVTLPPATRPPSRAARMKKPSQLPSGASRPEPKIAPSRATRRSVWAIERIGQAMKYKLYVPEGYSSMFMYCTEALGLSEDAAGMRIAVARKSLRFPTIIAMLADGRLHLTGAAKLARHLT